MVQPALSFVIPDTHPEDVVEEVLKRFPHIDWCTVSFDDDDADYMLVKASCGAQVEVRTGQPLVVRT